MESERRDGRRVKGGRRARGGKGEERRSEGRRG